MNLTPNVYKDLLTLYLAGEAHPDTRELVEEWLRGQPGLVRQVERARQAGLPPVALPPPTAEKQALDRTRRRWRIRTILFCTAVYFSTLPLSVTFGRSGYEGVLIKDWPARFVALAVAAGFWAAWAVLSLRWRSAAQRP